MTTAMLANARARSYSPVMLSGWTAAEANLGAPRSGAISARFDDPDLVRLFRSMQTMTSTTRAAAVTGQRDPFVMGERGSVLM